MKAATAGSSGSGDPWTGDGWVQLVQVLEARPPSSQRQRVYPDSQEPVDGDDQGDILGGQAHGTQHDHHGHQAGLRHPRGSNAGRRGRDAAAGTHERRRSQTPVSLQGPSLAGNR